MFVLRDDSVEDNHLLYESIRSGDRFDELVVSLEKPSVFTNFINEQVWKNNHPNIGTVVISVTSPAARSVLVGLCNRTGLRWRIG